MTKSQAMKKVQKCSHTLPENPILTQHTGMLCTCRAELEMLGPSLESGKFFPAYLVCPSCGTVTVMPYGGRPNLKKHTPEELRIR